LPTAIWAIVGCEDLPDDDALSDTGGAAVVEGATGDGPDDEQATVARAAAAMAATARDFSMFYLLFGCAAARAASGTGCTVALRVHELSMTNQ
jgi:hypothetical protein